MLPRKDKPNVFRVGFQVPPNLPPNGSKLFPAIPNQSAAPAKSDIAADARQSFSLKYYFHILLILVIQVSLNISFKFIVNNFR